MARTNEGLVRGILTKDYDERKRPSLEPFIAAANAVVDRVVTCATDKGIPITTVEAELTERWLAAHFYKYAYDRQFTNKSTGGASGSYTGQTATNFDGTTYGQMAQMIDFSGCLTIISKVGVASAFWMGKAPSSQIPYVDRN